MSERVLALDMSTKTGWSLIISGDSEYVLEAYGKIKKIEGTSLERYPISYLDWAYQCYGEILKVFEEQRPDVLVIEETAGGSKSAYSQKILEWIHFLVARLIQETGITCHYYMTEEWRRECGCLMTKDEKKSNKKRSDIRKTMEVKGPGGHGAVGLARDENGKIIGKIGRKHVNVRRANEVFGKFLTEPLKMKDEDTADALLLAYAYHSRKVRRNE